MLLIVFVVFFPVGWGSITYILVKAAYKAYYSIRRGQGFYDDNTKALEIRCMGVKICVMSLMDDLLKGASINNNNNFITMYIILNVVYLALFYKSLSLQKMHNKKRYNNKTN